MKYDSRIFRYRAKIRQPMKEHTMRAFITDGPHDMFREVSVINEGTLHETTSAVHISIDRDQRYQIVDGFGASFTDSAAYLIDKVLTEELREQAMSELFDLERGIGLSVLRNPMGASDYARTVYSYDDLPLASADPQLRRFSIAHDLESIVPLTKQAMTLNRGLKLIASPWSAPGWMKNTHVMRGGSLRHKYYPVYAQYFVRFIQEYAKIGIPVYAITVQNEPLYMPLHYPSMLMPAAQEAEFVRNYLVPAFHDAGIQTKILGYDHNWDRPEYADELLIRAPSCFDGIAWHWYAGTPGAQDEVERLHPGTPMYFSEGSGGSWIPEFEPAFSNLMRMAIGALRHGAKTFVLWNVALDEHNGPTVPGFGKSTCRGLLRINTASRSYEHTLDYYGLAHFSKYVRPNAVHIGSVTTSDEDTGNMLHTVAFENVDGSVVCVAFNDSARDVDVMLSESGDLVRVRLPKHAACTFVRNR